MYLNMTNKYFNWGIIGLWSQQHDHVYKMKARFQIWHLGDWTPCVFLFSVLLQRLFLSIGSIIQPRSQEKPWMSSWRRHAHGWTYTSSCKLFLFRTTHPTAKISTCLFSPKYFITLWSLSCQLHDLKPKIKSWMEACLLNRENSCNPPLTLTEDWIYWI